MNQFLRSQTNATQQSAREPGNLELLIAQLAQYDQRNDTTMHTHYVGDISYSQGMSSFLQDFDLQEVRAVKDFGDSGLDEEENFFIADSTPLKDKLTINTAGSRASMNALT